MLTHAILKLSHLFLLFFTLDSWAGFIPLEEARKDLAFPEYSSAERELLAKQAEFFISNLYVHRDLKVKDFGSKVDPLPRLMELKNVAGGLSTEEFHSRMSRIFFDLHDLHTNYLAPTPVSCGAALIPLRFHEVVDGSRRVVVVSRKLKLNPEQTKDISIGDELISVDGIGTEEAISALTSVSGGANEDAMRSRATQLLSFRSGTGQALPERNSISLKLNGALGEYTKDIPWTAFIDEDCINNVDTNPFGTKRELLRMGVDEYQRRFNKIFSPVHPETNHWTWFGEEALKDVYEVALINTPAGKIGYVQLKSFHWSNRNLDIPTVIDSLRGEIENGLSSAIGLVIDVRGNPGGYIVLAEKLIQLFSTKIVEPTTVRMLANSLNQEIFLRANGAENRWTETIGKAIKAGDKYTKPLAITPKNEANGFGQVWFRPVVVLTDSSCYSACDLFAAGIQDAKAGVVIGLHKKTGAGGANVMEYRTFRRIMGPENNPFELLPFKQNMRVSWRQTIRSGLHQGELLEDAGVSSDVVIPLKKGDIFDGESKELMAQIHKHIDQMAPGHQSGLGVRKGSAILFKNGNSARWKETVYGVDRVDFYIGDKLFGSQRLAFSASPVEEEFFVKGLSADWTDSSIVIVGKRGSNQVFRVVRELMWRGDYVKIPENGIKIDFESSEFLPLRTVLLKGSEGSGWQLVGGALRIGKGPKYSSGVLARAGLPIQLNGKGATLILDLSLEAEDLNDSLRIYIINPDTGQRKNLFAGSEIQPVVGGKIPLPTDWERADLIFEFESDENWNMAGPILDNVRILQ